MPCPQHNHSAQSSESTHHQSPPAPQNGSPAVPSVYHQLGMPGDPDATGGKNQVQRSSGASQPAGNQVLNPQISQDGSVQLKKPNPPSNYALPIRNTTGYNDLGGGGDVRRLPEPKKEERSQQHLGNIGNQHIKGKLSSGQPPPGFTSRSTDIQMLALQQNPHQQVPHPAQSGYPKDVVPTRFAPAGLHNNQSNRQGPQMPLQQIMPFQDNATDESSSQAPPKLTHSTSWPVCNPQPGPPAPPPGFLPGRLPNAKRDQINFGYHPLTSSDVHHMQHPQTTQHLQRSVSAPNSSNLGPTIQPPSEGSSHYTQQYSSARGTERLYSSSVSRRPFKSLSSQQGQFNQALLQQGVTGQDQMDSILEKSGPRTSDYGGDILPPSLASAASDVLVRNVHDLSLDAEDISDAHLSRGSRSMASARYDLETDGPQDSFDDPLIASQQYRESTMQGDKYMVSSSTSFRQPPSSNRSSYHDVGNMEKSTQKRPESKLELLKAKVQRSLAEQRARKNQGLVEPSVEVTSRSTGRTKLRRYQEELAAPAMGGDNFIICAPTGCGKTLTAAAICRRRYDVAKSKGIGFKALFIVNIRHLTEQQTVAFQETFPHGTVATVGATDMLSKVLYVETHAVVMVTAQILLNALKRKEPDVHLGDLSMIIFDECHHTTQDHPYNEIMMKMYLKTKKLKLASAGVVGKSGKYLPQILGLSASLGVGHGNDAYRHILTLCGNLDAKNVIQVVHNKDELESFVNSPELDTIRYVRPRKKKGGEFSTIIRKIMTDVEGAVWPDGVPENHGSSSYEQWAAERRKEAEEAQERVQLVACLYLFEFNRSLMLYDELRAVDALRHFEAFMEKRDAKHTPVPIEEMCRVYFQENLERLRAFARAEVDADNPKLDRLGMLLRDTFKEKPRSKGNCITFMKLLTVLM